MNTRPLRIFLIGTTLAVGAVVGLAPASDAKLVTPDPSGPTATLPPIREIPPGDLDPCDIINCDPPAGDDCVKNPRLCEPPTTTPPETTPPTTRPPRTEPTPPKHRNPDVVTSHPVFTG